MRSDFSLKNNVLVSEMKNGVFFKNGSLFFILVSHSILRWLKRKALSREESSCLSSICPFAGL